MYVCAYTCVCMCVDTCVGINVPWQECEGQRSILSGWQACEKALLPTKPLRTSLFFLHISLVRKIFPFPDKLAVAGTS